MFESTLVESTTAKRGGKTMTFFVITAVVWVVALVGVIVGGILFYDAKLDEQMELLTMIAPPPPPPPPPPNPPRPPPPPPP